MFELYQNRIIDLIKKTEIDPYAFNRLTFLALELAGVPLEILHPELQIPSLPQYNPSQDELVLAQNHQSAEAIRDLIDTMPATNILSVAKFVSQGKPDFIVPFFTANPDKRAIAIHSKQLDDIGNETNEIEALRSCYLTAHARMTPKLDHNPEYAKIFFVPDYFADFTSMGVKPAEPVLVATWMCRAYRARLKERPDLFKIIFTKPDQDLSQTA